MNLLFATRRAAFPFIIGGTEVSLYELARALSQCGHNTRILGELSKSALEWQDFASIPKRLTLKHCHSKYEFTEMSLYGNSSIEIEYSDGCKSSCTLLADWISFLEREINEFRPDVVFTHLDGALDILLLSEKLSFPVIHFVRDTFNPVNLHPYLFTERFSPLPDLTIANSYYVANWFKRQVNKECKVVYPIVSCVCRNVKDVNNNIKEILFVNPSDYKGANIAYELAKLYNNTTFKIVPSWRKAVPDKWKYLHNTVVCNKYVKHEELFASADVVIVPTQLPEAFGRVAVEAQANCVPVLASKHSGFIEILGDSALLVEDYTNYEAWAKALARVIDNRTLRQDLVALGLKNVERFYPPAIVDKIEVELTKLLEGSIS